MADRHPITCHVLNTHNGSPAAGLSCELTLVELRPPPTFTKNKDVFKEALFIPEGKYLTFHGQTDTDGRVKTWQPKDPDAKPLPDLLQCFPSSAGFAGEAVRSIWSIRFLDVAGWYERRGVKCFWPEVEVKFVVEGKEGEEGWRHYHVPVLLGPWSYSTYRGS